MGGEEAGPQKTGPGSPLKGCAWRFCRRVFIVEDLLKNPHTEPQNFCRTLGAKPSFSDPAYSSPREGITQSNINFGAQPFLTVYAKEGKSAINLNHLGNFAKVDPWATYLR